MIRYSSTILAGIISALLFSTCMSPTDPDTPRRRITDPSRYFLRTIDLNGSEYDAGYDVVQLEDGGFIVTGRTWMQHTGSKDVLLLRTDAEGHTLWIKTYGGVYEDEGYSVATTTDGGFIITGFTESYATGMYDIYLIKTDAQGNQEWSKSFGGSGYDYGQKVIECANGDFVVVGYSQLSSGGNWSATILRTDRSGNPIWSRDFVDRGERNFGASITELDDGGFVVTGSIDVATEGNSALWLFKLPANGGDLLWEHIINGGNGRSGKYVVHTTNGGYAAAGDSYENADPEGKGTRRNSSILFVITDATGDLQTQSLLYDNASVTGLTVTPDGGYVLSGYTDPFNPDGSDMLLLRLDAQGALLWHEIIGGGRMDRAFGVDNTLDGGFIITGKSQSYGRGDEDIILLKTDAGGQFEE
ncbi:MAG: hypothetical protein JXA28_04895 [Bacteroidetes bacterium]|nr:hypothetical protein [Bacteroidota bacterium]